MSNFLSELARDEDLDDETKGTLKELAEDNTFLLAVEDYLARTTVLALVGAMRFPTVSDPPAALTCAGAATTASDEQNRGKSSWPRSGRTSRGYGRSWTRTTDLRLIRAAL